MGVVIARISSILQLKKFIKVKEEGVGSIPPSFILAIIRNHHQRLRDYVHSYIKRILDKVLLIDLVRIMF